MKTGMVERTTRTVQGAWVVTGSCRVVFFFVPSRSVSRWSLPIDGGWRCGCPRPRNARGEQRESSRVRERALQSAACGGGGVPSIHPSVGARHRRHRRTSRSRSVRSSSGRGGTARTGLREEARSLLRPRVVRSEACETSSSSVRKGRIPLYRAAISAAASIASRNARSRGFRSEDDEIVEIAAAEQPLRRLSRHPQKTPSLMLLPEVPLNTPKS